MRSQRDRRNHDKGSVPCISTAVAAENLRDCGPTFHYQAESDKLNHVDGSHMILSF